jgi:hypothetical protein
MTSAPPSSGGSADGGAAGGLLSKGDWGRTPVTRKAYIDAHNVAIKFHKIKPTFYNFDPCREATDRGGFVHGLLSLREIRGSRTQRADCSGAAACACLRARYSLALRVIGLEQGPENRCH